MSDETKPSNPKMFNLVEYQGRTGHGGVLFTGVKTELTMRDLFAAAALSGMTGDPIRSGAFELYGVDAYKFADAMLAQRERRMK